MSHSIVRPKRGYASARPAATSPNFSEDPATTVYTGWLQHFGAHGEVLAPELEIGAGSVPVFFAASPRGAVTLWRGRTPTEARLHARSVDRDGNPDGAVRDLPAEGQLYELALTSRSDGEALVLFLEHHDDTMPNAWLLRAQALAPDATARGEPTLLLSGENTTSLRVLMEESGSRALVLYDGDGVRALPLRCVGR